ncbi:outer membrane protein assembly factor BamB family protein [Magnetococcales bacterium HHB-1]
MEQIMQLKPLFINPLKFFLNAVSPQRRALMILLSLAFFLPGCSVYKSVKGFWGSDEEEEVVHGFVTPDPEQDAGLKEIWSESIFSSPPKHSQHPMGFVVTSKDIFVGGHLRQGLPFFRKDIGKVARIDREDGEPFWVKEIDAPVSGGVAVWQDRVVAGNQEGELIALRRDNGQELFRVRLSTVISSPIVVADGKAIFITLDNRTYAVNLNNGEISWVHASLPEALAVVGAAEPTVFQNVVYVGYSSGDVLALTLDDGRPIWRENLTSLTGRGELDMLKDVDAAPVVRDNQVFVVNHQGTLASLNAATGSRIWERSVSSIRRPLLEGDRLYISDMTGYVSALNREDGTPIWRTQVTDKVLTSPVFHRRKVIVADSQGRLFALDPGNGRIIGRDDLDENLYANMKTHRGDLFIWLNSGDLLRFD